MRDRGSKAGVEREPIWGYVTKIDSATDYLISRGPVPKGKGTTGSGDWRGEEFIWFTLTALNSPWPKLRLWSNNSSAFLDHACMGITWTLWLLRSQQQWGSLGTRYAGRRQEAGCCRARSEPMQDWLSGQGPQRWVRSTRGQWDLSGTWPVVGCNLWKVFLKEDQPLFLLLSPWNGDMMAAEAPSILHHEVSLRMKASDQRWRARSLKKPGSLALHSATGLMPSSILLIRQKKYASNLLTRLSLGICD